MCMSSSSRRNPSWYFMAERPYDSPLMYTTPRHSGVKCSVNAGSEHLDEVAIRIQPSVVRFELGDEHADPVPLEADSYGSGLELRRVDGEHDLGRGRSQRPLHLCFG